MLCVAEMCNLTLQQGRKNQPNETSHKGEIHYARVVDDLTTYNIFLSLHNNPRRSYHISIAKREYRISLRVCLWTLLPAACCMLSGQKLLVMTNLTSSHKRNNTPDLKSVGGGGGGQTSDTTSATCHVWQECSPNST